MYLFVSYELRNQETSFKKYFKKFLRRKKMHEGEKDIHFSSTNSGRASN